MLLTPPWNKLILAVCTVLLTVFFVLVYGWREPITEQRSVRSVRARSVLKWFATIVNAMLLAYLLPSPNFKSPYVAVGVPLVLIMTLVGIWSSPEKRSARELASMGYFWALANFAAYWYVIAKAVDLFPQDSEFHARSDPSNSPVIVVLSVCCLVNLLVIWITARK